MKTKMFFVLVLIFCNVVFGQFFRNPFQVTDKVNLCLPDTLYMSASDTTEYNVYFDNIIAEDYKDFEFDVTCDSGKQYLQGWRWMPDTSAVGTYDWQVDIYAKDKKIKSATMVLKVVLADTTAAGLNLLGIGDTYSNDTDSTKWCYEVKVMGGDSLVFIGTQGDTAIWNEAYAGKTFAWFESDSASPFVDSLGADIDMSTYLTDNSYDNPNIVVINLGAIDVLTATDATIDAVVATALQSADSLVNTCKVDTVVKIGVVMPIMPDYNQDAFGDDYSNGQTRWQFKENIITLNLALKAKWGAGGTDEDDQVFLIPAYLGVDTEHNFPTTSTAYSKRNATTFNKHNSGLYPSQSGYQQMADFIFGWMVNCW